MIIKCILADAFKLAVVVVDGTIVSKSTANRDMSKCIIKDTNSLI